MYPITYTATVPKALRAALTCLLGMGLALTAHSQTGFSEVAQSAGISQMGFNRAFMGGGSAWFDYDRDGDEDLVTTGSDTGNRIYRNDGNGAFTDVTLAAGFLMDSAASTMGVVTGDIDNDGYREIFVGTWWFQKPHLFKNNGDGTFTNITQSAGFGSDSIWQSAAAFADVNKDGFLDLYSGNYVWEGKQTIDSVTGLPNGYAHRCSPNSLWINNGDETFTNAAAAYALSDTGCALSVVLSDYDNDDDLDVWVANDFGEWVYPNSLYRNDGSGSFTDVSVPAGVDAQMYGMGFAVGDYDHDLDFDYYITNIGANRFFVNQGNGIFIDEAATLGIIDDSINGALTTGWGTMFMDYDNDSWDDLFLANGHIELINIIQNEPLDPDHLWRNNGDGTFSEVTFSVGLGDTNMCRGATRCDYDGDGDLDMYVSVLSDDTLADPRHSLLYRNELSNGNHWVEVRLEGVWSNRDAYGAKIRMVANGTAWLWELHGGSSHFSQHSSLAHFGLGSATLVDSMVVMWPSGIEQVLTGLAADSLYHVVEDTTPVALESTLEGKFAVYPNPSATEVWLTWEGMNGGEFQLRIVDLMGREVYGAWGNGKSGRMLWDGRNKEGIRLSAGTYWLLFEQEGRRKALLMSRQ